MTARRIALFYAGGGVCFSLRGSCCKPTGIRGLRARNRLPGSLESDVFGRVRICRDGIFSQAPGRPLGSRNHLRIFLPQSFIVVLFSHGALALGRRRACPAVPATSLSSRVVAGEPATSRVPLFSMAINSSNELLELTRLGKRKAPGAKALPANRHFSTHRS